MFDRSCYLPGQAWEFKYGDGEVLSTERWGEYSSVWIEVQTGGIVLMQSAEEGWWAVKLLNFMYLQQGRRKEFFRGGEGGGVNFKWDSKKGEWGTTPLYVPAKVSSSYSIITNIYIYSTEKRDPT